MMGFFRSMAGRVFLILIIGIAASVAITWWFAFSERQRALAELRESRLIEQAEQFIHTLDELSALERKALLKSTRRFGLRIELLNQLEQQSETLAPQDGPAKTLSERLGNQYLVRSIPAHLTECPPMRSRRAAEDDYPARRACEALRVRLPDASELRLTFFQPRGPGPVSLPRPGFNFYLAFFLASIAALAYLVSRIATNPLRRLAQAATGLGKNIDQPPLSQKGSTEIRQATAAFNAMQDRIKHHIHQRTYMLAAITHDLQTPLTRLRLRLEKVDDPALRERLIEDLAQTQMLVREGLELARSMDTNEPMQPLDIDSLLDSVCSDARDAGQSVSLHGKAGISVLARPAALRRCLINLTDNAVKYGEYAEVAVWTKQKADKRTVYISIKDGGPGIPSDQLQKVFDPFYRLETSRSRQTGGTGLGLTIARNIIEQHGGSVQLANREQGGLEIALAIPVNQA